MSVFDGMACGMLAMIEAGIEVERYVAFEIDKYATQTSAHNFPMIEHKGDVFQADFTEYKGFDFLVGGSPCTYWSIAKSKNREVVASGMGWELFSQYVRALKEIQPKYFIYENNKSMSKAIRESITEKFGFDAICINSALVSAQNRQRLYWCGIRNEDGTYRKANISQPEDRGIFLKDILETNATTWRDKSYTIDANYWKGGKLDFRNGNSQSHRRNQVAEPINITEDGKAQTLKAQYVKNSVVNFVGYTSTYGATGVAEPIIVAQRGRNPEDPTSRAAGDPTEQRFEANPGGKSNALTTVQKDNLLAEPINCKVMAYELESVSDKEDGCIAMLEMPGCHDILRRVYSTEGKSPTINTCGGGNREPKVFTEIGLVEVRGKKYPVYEVKNGMITVKGKTYPIKLKDGHYIIRKLTVRECMRLQTVPEWYIFPVSDSQAYKMLGNGWTVSVIAHLITSTVNDTAPVEECRQLTIFDYPEAIPEEMKWK